jgi:hypothetical protein
VSLTPPNEDLVALAAVLGDDATRDIVRLFLHSFPESMRRLTNGTHDEQVRIVHGIKSSALHMGATALSQRMAATEAKLGRPGEKFTEADMAAILADFKAVEPELRQYSGA